MPRKPLDGVTTKYASTAKPAVAEFIQRLPASASRRALGVWGRSPRRSRAAARGLGTKSPAGSGTASRGLNAI